jgi:tetratricopeptide (TPR) repeat protein
MAASNELRVFISSTFRDLQEEREHLVKRIFPEIRALCRERGITFTEVDLRWGLTEENVVLGQVIRTCLEEIDRCRPYFIGITGERYGFVPELAEYYKDPELLARHPWLEDAAIEQASIMDLEFRHAVLDASDAARRAARFFFRRNRRGQESDVDHAESARLDGLRARVRDACVDVEEFRDPGHLGEAVRDALVEIIERDFAHAAPPSPLEEERARHRAFGESRRHAYIPNGAYLGRLNGWLAGGDGPLVIHADSGSGKSSLVSFWCEQLRRRQPELAVVEHYVGIGAGSSDHLAIMRHVIDEIRERYDRTESIPSKSEELEQQFGNWLGFALGAPLLIVIDGINQLSGHGRELRWLPPSMPPGVKLIITSTAEETLVELRDRGWETLGVEPLTEPERQALVVRFLAEYHKALSAEQVHRIAIDAKSAHPLYLKTLLEELRLEARHETIDRELARYLGASGTDELFQLVLERMEEDYGRRSLGAVMSLLFCSRAGLDEHELQELTGISRLKLSTMLMGLDYHLVRKDGVLTFFHDYLRRAVEARYLADPETRRDHHYALAEYFEPMAPTLRTTKELLGALEALGERERYLAALAEISRFALLWPGEGQYEVLRGWQGVVPERIGATVLAELARWRSTAGPGPAELDETLGELGEFLLLVSCLGEAELVSLERVTSAREAGDPSTLSRALSALSTALVPVARYDEALIPAREAESIARATGDAAALILALTSRGNAHWPRGEYDEALACHAERESAASRSGDRKAVGMAVGDRGVVYWSRGEYDEALACFRLHETIAREIGNRENTATAIGNRGLVHIERGEDDLALECLAIQESIARELGDRRTAAIAIGNRGTVLEARGELDEALACFVEQASIARALGTGDVLGYALGNHGYALAHVGQFEVGLTLLAEAARLHISQGDLRGGGFWYEGTAVLLLDHAPSALGDFPWPGTLTVDPCSIDVEQLALMRVRALADEVSRIATVLSLTDLQFRAAIVAARLLHREDEMSQSRQQFHSLIAGAASDEHRAECHYWLWKLALEPEAGHSAIAERLYSNVLVTFDKRDIRNRLEELRVDRGGTQFHDDRLAGRPGRDVEAD